MSCAVLGIKLLPLEVVEDDDAGASAATDAELKTYFRPCSNEELENHPIDYENLEDADRNRLKFEDFEPDKEEVKPPWYYNRWRPFDRALRLFRYFTRANLDGRKPLLALTKLSPIR